MSGLPEPYYEHKGIVIFNSDCRDILPHLPKVDLVLTDPPYGVGLGVGKDMRAKGHGLAKGAYKKYEDTLENLRLVVAPVVRSAIDAAGRGIVFSGPNIWEYEPATTIGGIFCPSGVGYHSWGFNTFIPILFYGNDPSLHDGAKGGTVLQSTETAQQNGHPCPKPLGWMKWAMLRGSTEGQTILDPFMGSGTTLVAAKQLGRRAIGIEICEAYCAIAVKRLAQEMLPFAEPEPQPEQMEIGNA